MKTEDKVQIIKANNLLWEFMKKQTYSMKMFFLEEAVPKNIASLLHNSLKLIISELILNKEKYKQYPVKNYEGEDFVNLIIESIVEETPNIKNKKDCEKYVEKKREIIWGYIKTYTNEIFELLRSFNTVDENFDIDAKNFNLASKCLMVILVESCLRDIETEIIELNYKND